MSIALAIAYRKCAPGFFAMAILTFYGGISVFHGTKGIKFMSACLANIFVNRHFNLTPFNKP